MKIRATKTDMVEYSSGEVVETFKVAIKNEFGWRASELIGLSTKHGEMALVFSTGETASVSEGFTTTNIVNQMILDEIVKVR